MVKPCATHSASHEGAVYPCFGQEGHNLTRESRARRFFFTTEMAQLEILTGRGAVSKWATLSHGVAYEMSDFHKHETVAVRGNTGVLFQFKVTDYDDAVERFLKPFKAACASRKIKKPAPTDRLMAFYETKGICRVFVVIPCAKNGYADPAPRPPMELVAHYKSLIPTYVFYDADANAAAMSIFNAWLAGESPFSAKMPGATTPVETVPEVAPAASPVPKNKKRSRAPLPPPPPSSPSSQVAVDLSLRIDSPAPLLATEFADLDRLFTDAAMGFIRPLPIPGDALHIRYVIMMQFPNLAMRNWVQDALASDRLEVSREIVKSFVSRIGHRDTNTSGGIDVVIDTCSPVGDVVELSYVAGDIRCPMGVSVGLTTATASSAPTLAVTIGNVRTEEEYASVRALWNECVARADVHQPIRRLIGNRCRGEYLTAKETEALRKFGEEVERERLLNVIGRIEKMHDESQLLRLDTYFKWANLQGEKSPDDEQVMEFSFDGMGKKHCAGLERLLDGIEAEAK